MCCSGEGGGGLGVAAGDTSSMASTSEATVTCGWLPKKGPRGGSDRSHINLREDGVRSEGGSSKCTPSATQATYQHPILSIIHPSPHPLPVPQPPYHAPLPHLALPPPPPALFTSPSPVPRPPLTTPPPAPSHIAAPPINRPSPPPPSPRSAPRPLFPPAPGRSRPPPQSGWRRGWHVPHHLGGGGGGGRGRREGGGREGGGGRERGPEGKGGREGCWVWICMCWLRWAGTERGVPCWWRQALVA